MKRVDKEVEKVNITTNSRVGQVFKIAKAIKGQTPAEQATAKKQGSW